MSIKNNEVVSRNGSVIYTLKLENNKYYVGKTTDIQKRYLAHLAGLGSRWTKIYKPIGIISQEEEKTLYDEDNKVKEIMCMHGIENVRGGSYCRFQLSDDEIRFIKKELNSIKDECFNCGEKGHYIGSCPNIPSISLTSPPLSSVLANFTDILPLEINCESKNNVDSLFCNRCFYTNHTEENCYAFIDKTGKKIPRKRLLVRTRTPPITPDSSRSNSPTTPPIVNDVVNDVEKTDKLEGIQWILCMKYILKKFGFKV